HFADDAQYHRHHGAVLADRHLRQFRHCADHDGRRSAQHDAHVRHLCLPARYSLRRSSAGRSDVAVHAPDPGDRCGLHPARLAQARGGDGVSTATIAVPAGKTAPSRSSLRRSRRWALFASYFFLILFAIFFLMPPYYMIVTALKSDAEMARL